MAKWKPTPVEEKWQPTPVEEPELEQDWGDSHGGRTGEPPPPKPDLKDPGILATLGHKALQGFFKGHSDELVGAGRAQRIPTDGSVGQRMRDGSTKLIKSKDDAYRAGRDDERNVQDGASEHHPWLAGGAEAAGDLASDAVLKTFGVPAESTAYQTLMGALQGLGNSDAELTGDKKEIGKAAVDAGIGGALGYVGGKYVGPFIGKHMGNFARYFGGKLKDVAEERAVKATGMMLADARALAERGEHRLGEVGRELLDKKVVTPLASRKVIGDRAEKLAKEAGAQVGDSTSKLDDALMARSDEPIKGWGPLSGVDVAGFKPSKVADRIEKEILEKYAKVPAFDDVVKGLRGEVEKLRAMGEANIPYKEAQAIKKGMDEFLNWGKEQTPAKELQKRMRGIINNEINEQATKLAPEQAARLKDANRTFGIMKESAETAKDHVKRELANRFVSPSDYGVGGAGALAASMMSGGEVLPTVVTGAALAGANKLARKYGNQVAATGADRVAKILAGATDKLGKYGPVLSAATGRNALLALDSVLQQKFPDYKELRDRLLSSGEEQDRGN